MGPTGASSSGTGPTGTMGPTGASSSGTGPTGTMGTTGPTGPGLAGVTTISTASIANGAQITTDNYLQLAYANGGGITNTPGLQPGSYSDIFSTQTIDFANFGQTWVQNTSAPQNNWRTVAMSSSGQYQLACINGGDVYNSSDYGKTWSSSNSPTSTTWNSLAISSNGQYQTAVTYNGYIYSSANYGSTWTSPQNITNSTFLFVTISASGQYQTLVSTEGSIYISADYGSTWSNPYSTSKTLKHVAMSSSGQYQTALGYKIVLPESLYFSYSFDNSIYISSNYGLTWTEIVVLTNSNYFSSVCISASGQYQTVSIQHTSCYISSDYGKTWSENTTISPYYITMSASGQYQVSANSTGIYISLDYGQIWTLLSGSSGNLSCVAMSSSGQYMTACGDYGYIYTCQNSIANGIVSIGSYDAEPSGGTISSGSIYYNTTDSALKVYNGSTWSEIGSGSSSGSGLVGVTTISTASIANGAQITTDNYLQLGPADSSNPGLITTDTQTFNGSKIFVYDLSVNGITVGLGGGSISSNVAIGSSALSSNTSGNQNIAIGYEALLNRTGEVDNVGIGYKTLHENGGTNNTAVGNWALNANVNSNNVGVGYKAGGGNTGGYNNVYVGFEAGVAGTTNNTGNNNTFIGYQAQTSGQFDNSTALGAGAIITANNQIVLGTSSETVKVPGNLTVSGSVTATSFKTTSDYRIKESVKPIDETYTIDQLRPVIYKNTQTEKTDMGFIAHELQEVYPFLVEGEKDGESYQNVNYTGLIALLIKEMKEMKQKINNLENKLK